MWVWVHNLVFARMSASQWVGFKCQNSRYICLQDWSYATTKIELNSSKNNPKCCLMEGIRKILNQYVSLTKTSYMLAMLCQRQGGRWRKALKKKSEEYLSWHCFLFKRNSTCYWIEERCLWVWFLILLAYLYFFKPSTLNGVIEDHFLLCCYTAPLT